MNTVHLANAAQRLELLVLQHRGQEVDFSWQWPPGASLVSLDHVLSALEGVEPTFLAQVQSCILQRTGTVQQPVWCLGNRSADLVCSVNAQVLAAGSQLRLDHGDEIEIGLLRLLVCLEPSQGPSDVADGDASRPGDRAAEQGDAGFALTDLDAPGDTVALTDAQRQGLKRSDFADLISLEPQEPAPSLQAAAPVLHAVLPEPPDPLAESAALQESVATSYAEKVSGLLAQFQHGADRPEAAQSEVDDLLSSLHTRYLEKLLNPERADADDQWQDLVRGTQARQIDPLQHWMQAAGSNPSLDDFLGQQQSIASVMQGLDGLGNVDVLAPEPIDSVLHLFAPEHMRSTAQDSLESLVRRSLPGLTLREHHSLSVDSAMPFTGGQELPNPNPQTP
ncbi:hypothetical protein DIC66_14690 [Rhodoferax lacus]|uniref:TagK domain-containing protein n=1 Tax=Rhodoferax lacus TaxID=2184758 RepID=A0A3E1RAJ0_9BURK|nr:TagK domain-containing protein [Rhodoferax lacus]RFO96241.1 hypothetical protein DIC66_14690 [Rhodoferax lacus]